MAVLATGLRHIHEYDTCSRGLYKGCGKSLREARRSEEHGRVTLSTGTPRYTVLNGRNCAEIYSVQRSACEMVGQIKYQNTFTMRFSHTHTHTDDYCECSQLIHTHYMFRQDSTILRRNNCRLTAI